MVISMRKTQTVLVILTTTAFMAKMTPSKSSRGTALGHGARDQVTVSKQLDAGRPDLGPKPANADPARACGTVEEELHQSTLSTLAIPP